MINFPPYAPFKNPILFGLVSALVDEIYAPSTSRVLVNSSGKDLIDSSNIFLTDKE